MRSWWLCKLHVCLYNSMTLKLLGTIQNTSCTESKLRGWCQDFINGNGTMHYERKRVSTSPGSPLTPVELEPLISSILNVWLWSSPWKLAWNHKNKLCFLFVCERHHGTVVEFSLMVWMPGWSPDKNSVQDQIYIKRYKSGDCLLIL